MTAEMAHLLPVDLHGHAQVEPVVANGFAVAAELQLRITVGGMELRCALIQLDGEGIAQSSRGSISPHSTAASANVESTARRRSAATPPRRRPPRPAAWRSPTSRREPGVPDPSQYAIEHCCVA